MKNKQKIEINFKNRKAFFNYEIIESFTAGLILIGSEVKALRSGNITFTTDCFVYIKDNEAFLKNLNIPQYKQDTSRNYEPLRERKLLLTQKEINKLVHNKKEKNLTIVPLGLFVNEKGVFKLNIGLCRGKNTVDKRATKKEKDIKRQTNFELKHG